MIRAHFFREKQKAVRIPVTFYSKAGKKRLIKIWNAQNLGNQLLFASLTNNSNEAAIRERVTDYMQNYLQACLSLQKELALRRVHQNMNERQVNDQGDLTCRQVGLQQAPSSILERRQQILTLREAFQERCLQDEGRISKRTPCEYDQKEDETEAIEFASATTGLKPESSPVNDGNLGNDNDVTSLDCKLHLPLPSRSSGFEDATLPPTPTSSKWAGSDSDSKDEHGDDDDGDNLFHDFNEGRVIETLIKGEHVSDDEQEECESTETKLSKVLSREVELGWISPLLVNAKNVFREKNIEEICNAADQILKCHQRESQFAEQFSEELEALLRATY